jgi:hypothetical protein
MTMVKKLLVTTVFAAGLGISFGSPASAYVVCNSNGDCWHADERVTFPGVTLSFHDDKWRDEHHEDSHYSWHDPDNDHDWHHGYWDHGNWHSG